MTAAAATAPRHRSILSVLVVALLVLGVAVPGPAHPARSDEDAKPVLVAQQSPHFVAAPQVPPALPPDRPALARPAEPGIAVADTAIPAGHRPSTARAARAPPAA
ncbi:hypothetical protein [Amycolatopsis sp. FDAARGOS 1241]|uniref:hypothetical protein n=1 Tax=Amycolatopsis sp. FDAARGOS 1241 TaxID=2778070 RepID=UPI00194F7A7B|nr:hypothetical protein [Amycolatopsis sp. FDAARGOS 1241]QRP48110.1 hypothetical protein I6J71_09625 [Amycolatopsis sp. FDAARGOS 1241]